MRRGSTALLLLAACATAGGGVEERAPLEDPVGVATAAEARSGPAEPHRVVFEWAYTDRRGPVEGDGVLRYNPKDSLRLDLFGPGDGSMAISLTSSGLRTLGQIEEVRLPPPPYLYATAGIFRPGSAAPTGGFVSAAERYLVYEGEGRSRRFTFRDGRLVRVTTRSDGRTVRELELRWAEGVEWPAGAEYVDRERGSRARWSLQEAKVVPERFPRRVYELPAKP